jgi:hypothetical protein
MKLLNVVILALVLVLGVNSLPKATSTEELAELLKRTPRHQLGMYQSDVLIYVS